MGNLADAIEAYILARLVASPDAVVVLRRKDVADTLDCAPSQISYVLNTRFSSERGYYVESRRGSGGFVKIASVTLRPAPRQREDDVRGAARRWFRQCRQRGLITSREEALLARCCDTALAFLPPQQQRQFVQSLVEELLHEDI